MKCIDIFLFNGHRGNVFCTIWIFMLCNIILLTILCILTIIVLQNIPSLKSRTASQYMLWFYLYIIIIMLQELIGTLL